MTAQFPALLLGPSDLRWWWKILRRHQPFGVYNVEKERQREKEREREGRFR